MIKSLDMIGENDKQSYSFITQQFKLLHIDGNTSTNIFTAWFTLFFIFVFFKFLLIFFSTYYYFYRSIHIKMIEHMLRVYVKYS